MSPDKKSLVIPILLITVGCGWLLSTVGVAPSIDWIWTLGLAVVGILSIVICGVDKVTVVIAPLFLLASCLSVLRQTGRLSLDIELPILVIASGLLLLAARLPRVPAPGWLTPERAANPD